LPASSSFGLRISPSTDIEAVGWFRFTISSPQLDKPIDDHDEGKDDQQFGQSERIDAGMMRGRRWKHPLSPSPASETKQVAWAEDDCGDQRDDDQLRQWNEA
jgi:hypothetical protein